MVTDHDDAATASRGSTGSCTDSAVVLRSTLRRRMTAARRHGAAV